MPTAEKYHWRIYKVVLDDKGRYLRIDLCECEGQAAGTFVVNDACPIHGKDAA